MAYHPDLTDEQRDNLRKLAAYLRTLPADYPDFEMNSFTADFSSPQHVACGTAACAVGHGPVAGIAPDDHDDWVSYSNRSFVDSNAGETNDNAWDWCFESAWSVTDNTVHGAAARIELMLADGFPYNWEEQMLGDAPLSYTVAA